MTPAPSRIIANAPTRAWAFVIAILISCATNALAQTVVGPGDIAYRENISVRNDFADSFFNADGPWFSLGPNWLMNALPGGNFSRGNFRLQYVIDRSGDRQEATCRYEGYVGTLANAYTPHLFSTASFALRGGDSVSFATQPNAPTAASDTFTWNNTGSGFNTAASWTNTGDASNAVPNFNNIADFSVSPLLGTQPNLSATTAVRGVTFGVTANGFVLSNSNNAQLAVGADGIQSSSLGTNTISAPLVLNMSESINQTSGGTLNITGPVVLGAQGGITLTIGAASGNGTINFTPATVELAGDLTLVTNVNVTLPSIALLAQPNPSAALTKNGNATLTLTAGSTYNGLTTVNAGTLLITNPNGSATGTGAVLVNNGGTLSGTGFINSGANTITINGVLSPGASPAVDNPGTIHLASSAGAGALTLTSSSNLHFDITDMLTKDVIALTTTGVSLQGGTLTLNLAGGFDYTQPYAIFTGVSGLTGSFGSVAGYDSVNWAPVFTLNGTEYDLTFEPIPEPATWIGGALALGAIAFVARRRRRMRSPEKTGGLESAPPGL